MRFGLVARPVYVSITNVITSLLTLSLIDPRDIGEIVYVGGSLLTRIRRTHPLEQWIPRGWYRVLLDSIFPSIFHTWT